MVEHGIQAIGLDMFEHIQTYNKIRWRWFGGKFLHRGVIIKHSNLIPQLMGQTSLAGAIVEQSFDIQSLGYSPDLIGIENRGGAIFGIVLVQFPIQLTIFWCDQQCTFPFHP